MAATSATDSRAGKGVRLVAIAPNGPQAVGPSALNYTDLDDSFESMKIRAASRHFNFDYLYDGDTQSVARTFGPKVTPHIFIFDEKRNLRFEGRIDDRMQEAKAKSRDARDAIDALLAHQPIKVTHRHAGEVEKAGLRHAILGHLPDAGFFAGNAEYWRQ